MKVLYIARLFSGLENSLQQSVWAPSGVPTIFKMIEALAVRAQPLRLILARKPGHGKWLRQDDAVFACAGLNAEGVILAGAERFPSLPGRVARMLAELRHIWIILRDVRRFRPDVIYVDHGNVWVAGLLARWAAAPVIFRVMGVYPAMRAALVQKRPSAALLRWCYRAPYAAVICTQDSSGVETWLQAALDSRVPRYTLVNGVDLPAAVSDDDDLPFRKPEGATTVGFLGKLEWTKGCDEFLAGFLDAWKAVPSLHAVFIGAGSREAALRETAAAAGASGNVTFISHVPHATVLRLLRSIDIYVSMNRFGNLSVANLEAMRLGLCMIFPAAQPETGVDMVTDRYMPAGTTALRIAAASDFAGLAAALVRLHADPGERQRRAEATAQAAAAFIPSWKQRIDAELDIVEAVAAGRPVMVPAAAD